MAIKKSLKLSAKFFFFFFRNDKFFYRWTKTLQFQVKTWGDYTVNDNYHRGIQNSWSTKKSNAWALIVWLIWLIFLLPKQKEHIWNRFLRQWISSNSVTTRISWDFSCWTRWNVCLFWTWTSIFSKLWTVALHIRSLIAVSSSISLSQDMRVVALKLSGKYYRLFEILENVGQVAFRFKLAIGAKLHPVFHVSLLLKEDWSLPKQYPHIYLCLVIKMNVWCSQQKCWRWGQYSFQSYGQDWFRRGSIVKTLRTWR